MSGVGVAWASGDRLYPLRAPRNDKDGFGEVVVFQWSPHAAPPKPPTGFWAKFEALMEQSFEAQAEANRLEAQGYQALGDAAVRVVERAFDHKKDTTGIVLDIACVALSLALLPTGVGALAVLGLVGGTMLLGMDGVAYAKELGGDDAGADAVNKATEKWRIFATIITLPDFFNGLCEAIPRIAEARSFRVLDQSTAAAASRMAARTANAGRAERFAQIAEKANLRAQIRTEVIRAAMVYDMSPRVGATISMALLIHDEVTDKASAARDFIGNIQIHCMGMHK